MTWASLGSFDVHMPKISSHISWVKVHQKGSNTVWFWSMSTSLEEHVLNNNSIEHLMCLFTFNSSMEDTWAVGCQFPFGQKYHNVITMCYGTSMNNSKYFKSQSVAVGGLVVITQFDHLIFFQMYVPYHIWSRT